MRTPEQVRLDFVRQWWDKAQKDLDPARVLLEGDLEDYENVGFHAQQAVEKFIKAFLVHHQVEFPKTHDILLLRKLVAEIDQSLADSLSPADALTPYGVEFRYPGDLPEVPFSQAEQALQLGEQIRDAIQARLEPHPDSIG